MKLSIRARLTLGFTFVFAALLVLFTGVVYVLLKAGLEQKLKEDSLHDMGVLVANLIKPNWRDEVQDMPDESDEFRLLIRVFDENGKLLITGGRVTEAQWPIDSGSLVESLNGPVWDELLINDVSHQIYTHAFTPPGEKPHFVRIANSMDDNEWILNHFVYYINIGSFLVLVAAIIAGFFLSKSALLPVEKIRARAALINSDRLEERLTYDGPPDELHRLTKTLNDLLARIEHTISQTKRFIADASHELRIPLTGLRGTVEVAMRKKRSLEEHESILNTVHNESERLSELVWDLLSLARADAGGMKLEKTEVDIGSFLKNVFDEAEALNAEKSVTIRLGQVPSGKAVFDEAKIHQLLINLIENAIRYNKPGGEVIISAEKNDKSLSISVKDTGLGIMPDDQEKIFERFYRVDKARSREAGGTGLGLSIVRAIAEAHNGTITVQSVFSQGSVFTLTLPLS